MEMNGEQRIPADRQTVWNALNDPEILRRCIPGCQELKKESDTEMTALAVVKVGPIAARFQGRVTLSELDPPNGYRISGEGQGGVAGHARGSALVRLEEDGDGTLLTYQVSAQIGGKLAQLGARMIDATARTMAAAFFRQFAAEIGGTGAPAEAVPSGIAGTAAPAGTGTGRRQDLPAAPVPLAYATPAKGQERWIWLLVGLFVGALGAALLVTQGLPSVIVQVVLVGLAGFLLGRLGAVQPTTIILDRSPVGENA
ncbi:MAG TPA: carbon monoxide dehydrogenase subunit G [Novosphingobium sp.]|nr:carbon monoxide dehydrogenase subunit G [Novosphingobium sp.]